jgi:hypothetical protein
VLGILLKVVVDVASNIVPILHSTLSLPTDALQAKNIWKVLPINGL